METAIQNMKAFHGSQTPKSPKLRDRDTSFSANLRPPEPFHSQKRISTGPGRSGTIDDSTSDFELSIFDAHKYYNEPSNNEIQKVNIGGSNDNRVSPVINVNAEHNSNKSDILETSRSQSVNPIATSEASCNSQTGLSSDPSVAIAVCMKNPHHPADPSKKTRAAYLFSEPIWGFRSKCPCSGGKSIQVRKTIKPKFQMPQTSPPCLSHNQIPCDSLNHSRQEFDTNPNNPAESLAVSMKTTTNKPEPNKIAFKSNQDQKFCVANAKFHESQPADKQAPEILQSQRVLASVITPFTGGFSFPVLNSESTTSSIKTKVANEINENPSHDSSKVFKPPKAEFTSIYPKSVVRNCQNFAYLASPKSKIIDEDAVSDASSDLFEIESFSTQTASTYSKMARRRDSIDEAPNWGLN